MAKTQLNLELSYKGKVLDYIKSGSGIFKDKWFLGSNKHLLWQILLPAFPDKHQLISFKNNSFFMKLLPNATLQCNQDGKPVDKNSLMSNGLLQGDLLQLRSNMSGTLVLDQDWEVRYKFIEPYVYVLTHEQREIVAQYSRRAEATPQEKMGRTLILLFLFITMAVLLIYDIVLKPDAVDAGTLEASLARLQKAQRVDALKPQNDMPQVRDADADAAAAAAAEAAAAEAAAAAAAAGAKPAATTGRPGGAGTGGGQSAASLFGTFDPNAVVRGHVAVTGTREFVAASRGGGGGGGGTGPGGSGPGGGGGGGAGTAGGMGSTFDPNAVYAHSQSSFTGLSDVKVSGGGAAPTGPVATAGNLSQAQVAALGKPIAVTQVEKASISRIQSQAKAVTENTIATAPQESQTDLQNLRGIVNSRKGQLQSLYRKAAAIESISGAVDITIYGSGGKIEAVNVKPNSGNLTNAFLQDIQRAVKAWPGTSEPFIYTFTMRFSS